jgi:hypothetical protein
MIKYLRQNLKAIKVVGAPRHSSGINFENDPQKVPKQYRNMVGMKAYYEAMQELKSLSIEHKFDVVVLAYEPSKTIKKICLRLGLHMLDITPLWQKYVFEQNMSDAKAAWRLQKEDSHPSVSAHTFIASTLSKEIVTLTWNADKSRQSQ